MHGLLVTPRSTMISNEQPEKRRRKRVVARPPSTDYCRTCRQRRVKCDGERPACRRCIDAGRDCQGYASWHIEVDSPSSDDASMIPPAPNEGPSYRVQLLASFARQHYPGTSLAAPSSAHVQNWSFLHTLLRSNGSSPLLRTAMETLCLSHMTVNSTDRVWMRLPFQESYTRLLSMLRVAMATSSRSQSLQHHRDIAASMAALSLVPTSSTASEDLDVPHRTHLLAAANYLTEQGPSILSADDHFDTSLLRHVHVYLSYCAFVRRKKDPWDRTEWSQIQGLVVEPKPTFPAKSRYIPHKRLESEFTLFSVTERDLMLNFVLPLPGLLEEADNFVQTEGADTFEELQAYENLVSRLDDLYTRAYQVRPLLHQDASQRPRMIRFDEEQDFDMLVEEHVFMLNKPISGESYGFVSPEQAFTTATSHQLYLISDCALLQVMYNAYAEKKMTPSGSKISMLDVEQRAFWHASELCRSVHFYSQRGLMAARFTLSLLNCARSFYECYGATEETAWCYGCARATQARIERIQASAPPSICRLVDVVEELHLGCRYGPTWSGVVELV